MDICEVGLSLSRGLEECAQKEKRLNLGLVAAVQGRLRMYAMTDRAKANTG